MTEFQLGRQAQRIFLALQLRRNLHHPPAPPPAFPDEGADDIKPEGITRTGSDRADEQRPPVYPRGPAENRHLLRQHLRQGDGFALSTTNEEPKRTPSVREFLRRAVLPALQQVHLLAVPQVDVPFVEIDFSDTVHVAESWTAGGSLARGASHRRLNGTRGDRAMHREVA